MDAPAAARRTYRPLYLPPVPQDPPHEGRLILKDGTTASLRPSRPDDLLAVKAFIDRLSPESRRRRFFSAGEVSPQTLARLLDSSDPSRALTLLAFRGFGEERRVIGMGSYTTLDDGHAGEAGSGSGRIAEVSFVVDDAFQGRGLGTLLLERLSLVAVHHGIRRFRAVSHADNLRML